MFRKVLFIVSVLSLAVMSARAVTPVRAAQTQVPIFSDGFESGNLSAWSAKVTDAGDLAVTSPAALEGTKGMRAWIDDNRNIYVQDNTPNNEAVYNIHFHFDPNSIVMANLDSHNIIVAYDLKTTLVPAIRVELRFFEGAYQVRTGSRNDAPMSWTYTRWFTISNAEHEIEVEWDGASLPGQNDGKLKLKIDGVVRADRTGLDSDTVRIDAVRIGAVAGVDTGTRGRYFFDQFESYKD